MKRTKKFFLSVLFYTGLLPGESMSQEDKGNIFSPKDTQRKQKQGLFRINTLVDESGIQPESRIFLKNAYK